MAARADRRGKLASALEALARALDASGYPWMCIGGIAAIAQGVRRTTTDVDVAMRAEGIDLDALLRSLSRHRIRARIEHAAQFARESQVLLLEHTPTGVSLDLSFAWLSFEHEALTHAVSIDFGGVEMRAARPEDLLIYKLFAGRSKDIDDAEALLVLHRDGIDLLRIRRVIEQLAELAQQPEIAERLDELISKTKRTGTKRETRPKRR